MPGYTKPASKLDTKKSAKKTTKKPVEKELKLPADLKPLEPGQGWRYRLTTASGCVLAESGEAELFSKTGRFFADIKLQLEITPPPPVVKDTGEQKLSAKTSVEKLVRDLPPTPSVKLLQPTKGTKVSGVIPVVAQVLDRRVGAVKFYVDDLLYATIGNRDSGDNFTFLFGTTDYENGEHKITAAVTVPPENTRYLSETVTFTIAN